MQPSLPMESVGRYALLSTIGKGGMGTVYRARMEGLAGASKDVALKLMHAGLAADRDFVLMFLDEMRVAISLSHRNIVQTFDVGEFDGHYFMVMELLDAGSVRALLKARGAPLPLDIVLFIGREVCAALDYAHNVQRPDMPGGVVHRDVSPTNILLSGAGDVKLADFGIAKAAGRLYVTQANTVRGKLQYMAPEQAVGQTSPKSDLYALGAVLYELTTGRMARQGDAIDPATLAARPPRPSALRPGLPPSLDALIMACLAPEPAERPDSAGALRQALRQEAEQLGQQGDPHIRLQRYLAHEPAAASGQQGPRGRLAQAVLAEARAVATDPGLPVDGSELLEEEEATMPASSPGRPQSAATERPTVPSRPDLAAGPELETVRTGRQRPLSGESAPAAPVPSGQELPTMPAGESAGVAASEPGEQEHPTMPAAARPSSAALVAAAGDAATGSVQPAMAQSPQRRADPALRSHRKRRIRLVGLGALGIVAGVLWGLGAERAPDSRGGAAGGPTAPAGNRVATSLDLGAAPPTPADAGLGASGVARAATAIDSGVVRPLGLKQAPPDA